MILGFACALAAPIQAQQLIGYVNTHDAEITGASDVLDGQAVLTGSVSITAKDHTAPITLGRGGTARVCQTSVLHVTESREVTLAAPLLFSLDRGAIEILTNATPSDAIMTPDLRFTVRNSGPLDLRMRVARNGDTCVENRGPSAPTLAVSDPFGESMYELRAGQHVLFEHGSLHEVVDRETSPCGCPDSRGMSVADALLAAGPGANSGPKTATPVPVSAAPATAPAEQHPFPTAISEGLAPVEEVPPAPPGESHVQITDTLSYNGVTHDPDAQDSADQASRPASPPVSAKANPPGRPQNTALPSGQAEAKASLPSRPQNTAVPSRQTEAKTNPPGRPQNTVRPASQARPTARAQTGVQTHAQTAAIASSASAKTPRPASAPAAKPSAPPPPPPAPAKSTPAPAPSPPANDLAHVVGRLFHKLFGRG
jgi:hypothetical protein